MPGNATCENASAARVMRRITTKHPTRPATLAVTSSAMDVKLHRGAVDLLQTLWSEDLPRRTETWMVSRHAKHVRGRSIDHAEIVRDREDSQPVLRAEAVHEVGQALLAGHVYSGRELVEQ